jgi:hypothetical protein
VEGIEERALPPRASCTRALGVGAFGPGSAGAEAGRFIKRVGRLGGTATNGGTWSDSGRPLPAALEASARSER